MVESLLPMIQVCDSLFPIGAYTLSNGLETFVANKRISKDEHLSEYVTQYIKILPYNDLGLMSLSFKSAWDEEKIRELDLYATAIKAPMEVRTGSIKLCRRFMKLWKDIEKFPFVCEYKKLIEKDEDVAGNHSIAIGLYAKDNGLDYERAASIYCYSQISAIITNAVKSVPLSQRSGQQILQEAIELIPDAVTRAKDIAIDDLGVGGTEFDIYAMNHEYLYSRLYMS